MFHKADLIVITKVDLLPHLPDISLDRIRESLACVMPDPRVIELSARTGHGVAAWIDWLRDREPSGVPLGTVAAAVREVL
jgi:hydrogenase nickel incorporation protein HypB